MNINYIEETYKFIKLIPEIPNNIEKKKGLIICSGDFHFVSAFLCLKSVIHFCPDIFIEFYYCGSELFDFQKELLLKEFKNIELINCLDILPKWFPYEIKEENIKGYMIKPFALMMSKFEECLLLDADILVMNNFENIFEDENYKKYGNIFWPDIQFDKNEEKKRMFPNDFYIFEQFKVLNPYESNLYLCESGQILINRIKTWKALCLNYFFNYFNNYFYKYFFGDKDLYYLAFKILGYHYNQSNFLPNATTNESEELGIITSIIQKNPLNDNFLFLHNTISKININQYFKLKYIYNDYPDLYHKNHEFEELKLYFEFDKNNENILKDKYDIKNKFNDFEENNLKNLNILKNYYQQNISFILNFYKNAIINNIKKENNYSFKVLNIKNMLKNLTQIKIYLDIKNNIFFQNTACIYYINNLKYEISWRILKNIFTNKNFNKDSISILINLCCKNLQFHILINDILNDLNEFDYFYVLQILYYKNILKKNIVLELLNKKNNKFYDIIHFDKLKNIDVLEKNIDDFILNIKNFEKFTLKDPLYLNFYYDLSFKDNNNKNVREKISLLHRKLFPCLNYISSDILKNKNKLTNFQNKRKIGFISTNFGLSSVGRDRIGIIRNMNKDLFDVSIFHFNHKDDYYHQLCLNSGFKNIILPFTFEEQIKMIEKEKLDILIYADIGMQEQTYLLAHCRLAPTQMTTIGHSETSGINTIDYYISSELYENLNCQEHYSEKIILHKSLLFFYYDHVYDKILNSCEEYDFKFNKNYKQLVCLQFLHKISEDDLNIFYNIIKLNNNIELIFVNGTNDLTCKEIINKKFKEFINRIIILQKLKTSHFYQLIKKSYLILDTYPHGGCNTGLESFYYNKIVITKPSNFLRGRFIQGFYKKMNILDNIVNTNEEYCEKVNYYINNELEKNIMEQKINENKYILFNDLESIYEWNLTLKNI